MLNVKNVINEQNRNRLIDTKNRLMVDRREASWGGCVKR